MYIAPALAHVSTQRVALLSNIVSLSKFSSSVKSKVVPKYLVLTGAEITTESLSLNLIVLPNNVLLSLCGASMFCVLVYTVRPSSDRVLVLTACNNNFSLTNAKLALIIEIINFELASLAVPVPSPILVAVKIVPILLLVAPIDTKSVVPTETIVYTVPITNEPAVVVVVDA